jgi:hypothetical protein
MTGSTIENRLALLERQLRRAKLLALGAASIMIFAAAIAWTSTAQPQVLRVRGIIVVDDRGRERIYLGSPVPDPAEGKRIAPGTGLVINDSIGLERFGLSLFPNGNVVMGFDAPRGKGDDRNRERINIVADGEGFGYIRLLGRDTWAKAFLRLDADNQAYLDFVDLPPGKSLRRRFGLRGETWSEEPRKSP